MLSAITHAATETAPTPLTAALGQPGVAYCGARTPLSFIGLNDEIEALLHSAGVSDAGWRAKIRLTGGDRLRWLNGMVSNTVQSLPEGEGNYSFLLSVQGRIQGDCLVYRRADDLLLDTSRDQVTALVNHLDHFIIMDDVELADVSNQGTSLSLTGPAAPQILAALGFAANGPHRASTPACKPCQIGEVSCTLIAAASRIGSPLRVVVCSGARAGGLGEPAGGRGHSVRTWKRWKRCACWKRCPSTASI